MRAEKALFMIAEYRVCATILQGAQDLVGEAVFPDAIAETNQLVDITEDAQRLQKTAVVAVQIRDDADFQAPPPVPSPASGGGLRWGPRQRIRFIGFKLMTNSASWLRTST